MSSLYSLLYLGAVLIALLAYARHYQGQKRRALQNTAQFYEYSFSKDIYETVASNPTRNTKLEKAALLAWATEARMRTLKMMEAKAPLDALNQNGLVGDELFKRFMGSEVLQRQQIQGIAGLAEKTQSGWSQTILQTAQEVAQNHALRKRIGQLDLFAEEYRAFTNEPKA